MSLSLYHYLYFHPTPPCAINCSERVDSPTNFKLGSIESSRLGVMLHNMKEKRVSQIAWKAVARKTKSKIVNEWKHERGRTNDAGCFHLNDSIISVSSLK